ncbi:unnamed protein product [Adineta steineri]|uniref:PIPK domain-containing protein n=1 Tax=Adineta steineri TaxID=433720 RepID=A0A814DPN3_9BILA|nr:unnamed protein product [Adineta steineri]
MATNDDPIHTDKIIEGLYGNDLKNQLDFHLSSYVKTPIQLHLVNSKNSIIARSLRHAIVDLLDSILKKPNEYIENETTIMGTEHRLYHLRRYIFKSDDKEFQCPELLNDGKLELEISSLAPTVFYQLREDIGISNINFRESFSKHHLKDFTNPGKSGSLMYKTYDDLFILKTLRAYEARLLMQILSGYHLQLTQRTTILNRYVGLYSIRFPAFISSVEIYFVIMVNAFTSSLQINEIFDIKGSTIKRKLSGHLTADKLHNLKDVDFTNIYPHGIRISTNIYRRLHMVISNDVKVLKKLNITDFSLIIGIKHLDMTEEDLIQRRPATGLAALFHMSHKIVLMHTDKHNQISPSNSQNDLNTLSISYLKPLQMIGENIDRNLYYNNDNIAHAALPIPGLVYENNQRVYIYLAIVDILQTYDSFKYIEQSLKKITDPSRRMQYSVVDPITYEKRIIKFLFNSVFVDAGDSFPWPRIEISIPNADIQNQSEENNRNSNDTIDL